MHVAAVWGCRGALELLLSRGGDPTLRDQVRISRSARGGVGVVEEGGPWAPPAELTVSMQDGLRPLDWALQQGHRDCARLLRELDTPTRTRKETLESAGEQSPGGARNLSLRCLTSGSQFHLPILSITIHHVSVILSPNFYLSSILSISSIYMFICLLSYHLPIYLYMFIYI